MRRLAALSGILLLTFIQAACLPCDCKEATLINPAGMTLKMTFESPWFADDKFTITQIVNGEMRQIHGTYKESDDKITFNADGNVPFLSVKSGEVNALKCDSPRDGQFTVTPPAPTGGVALPLIFQCTKK